MTDEKKTIEPLVIDMTGAQVTVKPNERDQDIPRIIPPADKDPQRVIGFQCWEVTGMPVYVDQPDPIDPKTFIGCRERGSIKVGQTIIVGFLNGHVRMKVALDGQHEDLYLENDDMVSSLEFDEKWGWLATGFAHKKAIQQMRENMEPK